MSKDNCRQLTPVASSDSALIVPRAEWGALAPSSPILSLPALPQYVYIHHGATRGCSTEEECKEMARLYQKMHMHDRGWWDVGYSFMIGEDGNVYEGRGWDKVGAHTLGHNDIGVGICFIGNFDTRIPNDKALNALKRLINLGVSTGRLPHDYKLQRHCDVVRSTECPGRVFRGQVATWEHFHPTDSSFCPNV